MDDMTVVRTGGTCFGFDNAAFTCCPPLSTEAAESVQDLIIDTDMSIDVDDVGMLCAAHALADLGEARILATLHDSGATYGVGVLGCFRTRLFSNSIASAHGPILDGLKP